MGASRSRQAPKHHSTVSKIAAKHKAKVETSDGLRTCFEARKHREGKPDLVARFGGIILRQDRRAVIRDPARPPAAYPRKELIKRLRKRACELCETGTTMAVHQVASLPRPGASLRRLVRRHGHGQASRNRPRRPAGQLRLQSA